MLAHVLCPSRRSCITELIRTQGKQDEDWSKSFRLYSSKIDEQALFAPIIKEAIEQLEPSAPIVFAIDDSLLPKKGNKIPLSGYYRDAVASSFRTVLTKALKFIQISIAVPNPKNPKRATLIPVAFRIVPKIKKPSKKRHQK